jgi:glutamine amidotransferase
MIALIDYKAGNIRSVKKAFDHLGVASEITADPDAVRRAEQLVLPGVGHFAATAELDRSGLRDAIAEAIAVGKPFLGICVGMQWMAAGSSEAPGAAGLGLLDCRCERFPESVKSPHVGWNKLMPLRESRLLRGVSPGSFVYYSHSYRAPLSDATVAVTDYGGEFSAAVERGNAFGVQFHPEKSAEAGLQVLQNFLEL